MKFRAGRKHRKVLESFKSELFGSKRSATPEPVRQNRPAPRPLPSIEPMDRTPDPQYTSPCIYQAFYGFKRPPFNNTPDPNFFFLSEKHSEGLSRLLYAAQARKGFVLFTGEIGSGKTTICRALMSKLRLTSKVALITNTSITSKQLISFIAEEFHLPTDNKSKGEIISDLNRYLIEQLSKDRNVLLVLDEAQNLSNSVLEEIRMLSNLETTQEKLIQIMLVGQPELRDKINEPDLKQLRQRIALRYHIQALSEKETSEYIAYRLRIGNAVYPPRFSPDAQARIFEYSGGIPRLINTVCDNALVVGYTRETFKIDREVVEEIIADLEGTEQPDITRDSSDGWWKKFWNRLRGRR